MRVVNQARIDYKYRLCSTCPEIYKTLFSNVVITTLIPKILCVEKYVDKKSTSNYDVLTYTIIIKNITDLVVKNLFFEDILPANLKVVSNSITINGEPLYCMTLKKPIYIGSISPSDKIVITFKTLIVNKLESQVVCNYSTIYFDYIHNVDKAPITTCINSNTVCTRIEKVLFKQFNLSKTIQFSKNFLQSNTIFNVSSNIEILNHKFISSPITYTNNHTENNLCNILIIGKITYEVFSIKNNLNKKLYKSVYSHGFSTLLAIPYTADLTCIRNIKICTEDLSYCLIENKILIINSNLLLEI